MSPLRFRLVVLSLCLVLAGPAAAIAQPPRLDQYGDPLPDGALLRIGTVRLRTGAVVKALAFTTDGKKLVTADLASGVHVWDVATGKELWAFAGKEAGAEVALSPDGAWVAFIAKDKVCSVWDVARGEQVRRFEPAWSDVAQVQFSPDGKLLAATDWRRRVRLWEIATGKLLQTCEGDSYPSRAASSAFAPDGKTLVSASAGGPFVLINTATGKEIRKFNQARDYPRYQALSFSPDGKIVAGLYADCQGIDVWEVGTSKQLFTLQGNRSDFQSMTFTPDSRFLITGDSACDLCLWDLATGKLNRQQEAHDGWVRALAVSPDGKFLASSSDDHTIRIRDLSTLKPLHDFQGHQAFGVTVRFLPDGKTVVSTSKGGYQRWTAEGTSFRFWDAASGKELRRTHWDPEKIENAVLSGGGRRLVLRHKDGQVEVRDLESGKQRSLFADRQLVSYLLTDDGRLLAGLFVEVDPVTRATHGQEVKVIDVERGKVAAIFTDAGTRFELCAFGDEARMLALGRPNYLTIWNLRDRNQRRTTMSGPFSGVWALSCSGRLVAMKEAPTGLALHELATRQRVNALAAKGLAVHCVAFSRGGGLLAAGTTSGAILIWDVAGGTLLTELTGHRGPVASVDFSPDGKRLVSGGDDTTILIWDLERRIATGARPEIALTGPELEALWRELASDKAERAYAAMGKLVQAPKAAVPLLRQHLPPISAKDMEPIRRWIGELDSDKFAVRETATVELEKAGELALPLLEKVLADMPGLEVRQRVERILQKLETQPPSPARLRQGRALEMLEMLRTVEARALLGALAKGELEAWLTDQAKAACRRLGD